MLLTIGAAMVALTAPTGTGLALLLPGFLVVSVAFGMCIPTVSANAMQTRPNSAGAASALLGAAQFVIGGLIGPLAGRGASGGPLLLGAVMTALAAIALTLGWAGRYGQPISEV